MCEYTEYVLSNMGWVIILVDITGYYHADGAGVD